MPKYYVFHKKTGEVVNIHETISATDGSSLQCTREEVLDLVDEALAKREDLDILEVESDSQPAVGVTRVDTDKRVLVHEMK